MPSRKPFPFRSIFGYLRFAPIILYFLASSCANEAPPAGGKRDSTPPKVKYSLPANKSLNFNGSKIKIRFDEFIQQTIEPKEIVISPPMEKNPKFLVNGKNLIVDLQSKLKDSTTYTINFGDAVKDNNENIPLKNFTFVFATGSNLDSSEVSGQISNIKDPKNIDGVIIALYPLDSIDGILHSKPYYFAKTEKSGNFKISNIHSGNYRVYALKDENLNYIYDQSNELIGFMDSTIAIGDSSKLQISLSVFESKNAKPKFVDATAVYPGKVLISYNSPIKTLKFNSTILNAKDIIEINSSNDTLIYWYSDVYKDKGKLYLTVNDTLNDSTRVELRALSKDTSGDKKLYALNIESQEIKTDSAKKTAFNKPLLSPFKAIILNLSRPVVSIDSNKRLYVVNDSTGKKDTVSYVISEKTKRELNIKYQQQEKVSYTLVIPDSTFKDQWGWWNKPLYYKWNSDALENFGNIILSLKFEHPERYYIFKILDQQEQAIGTFYYVGNAEKNLTLKNIQAGIYHLQAIEDVNKNGEWDSGDFRKKTQPEKIIDFKETYELKGNWDLEIEVKL